MTTEPKLLAQRGLLIEALQYLIEKPYKLVAILVTRLQACNPKHDEAKERNNAEDLFLIDPEVVQAVVAFLQKQPYEEVHKLMPELYSLKVDLEVPLSQTTVLPQETNYQDQPEYQF